MRVLAAVSVVALLAAPACVPTQGAMFGPVDREIDRRLGLDVTWRSDDRVPAAVDALLKKPLDLDAALRIAMAMNQRLQASYEDLGIAASDVADATVLPPTEVDANYKVGLSGSGSEIELAAVQDVLALFQIGQRRGIAKSEVAAARARAVAATVDLAMRVEQAFYDAVAAEQERELRKTTFDAADAAAELTERMRAAGNTSELALVRDRDMREQARVDLARAEVEVQERRESLDAILGLSGDQTGWTISIRLPEVPEDAPALDDLERDAVAQSLDLAALRGDAEAAAGRVGYSRLRAWIPSLGVGVAVARRDSGEWEAGPALRFALPIFDQQQGPRARAHSELRRARAIYAAVAVELRAAARSARDVALEAHDEALHIKTVILPLRTEILDELVRQYNAMNASTFELISAKRDLVDAGSQYIEAQRRYWHAMAGVEALQRGVMPGMEAP